MALQENPESNNAAVSEKQKFLTRMKLEIALEEARGNHRASDNPQEAIKLFVERWGATEKEATDFVGEIVARRAKTPQLLH